MHISFVFSLLATQVFAGRFSDFARAKQDKVGELLKRSTYTPKNATSSFRYLSKNTAPYRVESLPSVPFDVGEMYSGLIPINEKDPDRSLFFVFAPTTGKPVDEVTIWLNGGPGCSSLAGFFQENVSDLAPSSGLSHKHRDHSCGNQVLGHLFATHTPGSI